MSSWHQDAMILAKAMHSVGGSLATVFLTTRLWARTQRFMGLWWDDYLLIASWATLLGCNGVGGSAPAMGFKMTPDGTTFGITLHVASICLGTLAIAWSKTAFATTLLRLTFGAALDVTVLWVLIVLLNGFAFAHVIVTCLPICDAVWTYPTLPVGCIQSSTYIAVTSANIIFSTLADITLSIWPYRILKRLTMSSHERKGLAIAMGLVGLTGLVGISRTAWTLVAASGGVFARDTTYDGVVFVGLVQLECVVMIIAQTVPIIRILLMGSRTSSRASAHGDPGNQSDKKKSSNAPVPRGIFTVYTGASLELVELPTGRIVTAEEARRLQQEAAPETHGTARPPSGVSRDVTQPVQTASMPANMLDDEVHNMWAGMGLSKKAWSPPRESS